MTGGTINEQKEKLLNKLDSTDDESITEMPAKKDKLIKGITDEQKEKLLNKLDSTDDESITEMPAKKDNLLRMTHVIQRKEKQIKEYNKIPILLRPIQGTTRLRETILLVLVNDKPLPYGVQAGDVWIELNKKTSVSNIKKAFHALERQRFIIKTNVNNLINKMSCPLYRINPKRINVKEVSGDFIEPPPIPQEPLEKEKTITKKRVESDVISERMATMELVTNQILNEENAKSKRMDTMELLNNQILTTLNDKNHIMPIIYEQKKMMHVLFGKMRDMTSQIHLQNLKSSKFLSYNELKAKFEGQFEQLDKRLDDVMYPIDQLSLDDLEKKINTLERINLYHGSLPDLYRERSKIYITINIIYKDRERIHQIYGEELWNRLTAPQRKQERNNRRETEEALANMTASDENVEEN